MPINCDWWRISLESIKNGEEEEVEEGEAYPSRIIEGEGGGGAGVGGDKGEGYFFFCFSLFWRWLVYSTARVWESIREGDKGHKVRLRNNAWGNCRVMRPNLEKWDCSSAEVTDHQNEVQRRMNELWVGKKGNSMNRQKKMREKERADCE